MVRGMQCLAAAVAIRAEESNENAAFASKPNDNVIGDSCSSNKFSSQAGSLAGVAHMTHGAGPLMQSNWHRACMNHAFCMHSVPCFACYVLQLNIFIRRTYYHVCNTYSQTKIVRCITQAVSDGMHELWPPAPRPGGRAYYSTTSTY